MYGYLKWNFKNRGVLTNTYRSYYCGLCGILKKCYGIKTTLLLSYEFTIMAIALSNTIGKSEDFPSCSLYKKKRNIKDRNNKWQQIVVAMVSIAYAKIIDDYLDNKRISSIIKMLFINLLASKIKKNHKKLFSEISNCMLMIKQAEDKGGDIELQSKLTSEMVIMAIQYENIIVLDEDEKNFLHSLIEWLCFVDAIDDYNEDFCKKRYNPLIGKGYNNMTNFKDYYLKEYHNLAKIYEKINSDLKKAVDGIKVDNNEKRIIEVMVYENMPKTIFRTINNKMFII